MVLNLYGMYRRNNSSSFTRRGPYTRTRKAQVRGRTYGQRPRLFVPRGSLKYYDQTFSTSSGIGLTGSGSCLNDMVQGTSVFNRIGNKIRMVYLQVNGYISLVDVYNTGNVDMWRWCLYIDKQTSGEGLISTTDMYYDVPGDSIDTLSHRNPYNMARFKVLRDGKRWIGPQQFTSETDAPAASIQNIPTQYLITYYIPLKNRLVTYNDTNGGTSADINTNALNFFAFTNGIDENGIQVLTMRFRLCYSDVR